jgi:multiple sugar transport system permease protein
MTLPAKELADVARIDGAGGYGPSTRLSSPIMKPALATQGFFAFVGSWNNFFMPFILITDWKLFTLPMMVALLQTEIHNVDFGSVYLGLGVSFLPILLVYTFFHGLSSRG